MRNKLFKGIILGLTILSMSVAVIRRVEPLPVNNTDMIEFRINGAEPLPIDD